MEALNQLSAIEFRPDGVCLAYGRYPTDIRQNGLIWQHQVLVPRGSDYDDEIEALMETAQALLTDVLEDEATAEPITPPDDDEDEDDD